MCWDADGNIVATCGWERSGPGPRIAVFATDGTVLEEHLLTAGGPTNCAFGGTTSTSSTSPPSTAGSTGCRTRDGAGTWNRRRSGRISLGPARLWRAVGLSLREGAAAPRCRAGLRLDRAPGSASMTLRRLKLLAILTPLLFLAALELARQVISPALFQGWPNSSWLASCCSARSSSLRPSSASSAGSRRSWRSRTRLLALHDAGLGILGELDLETVLQQVVDRARDLVGARYGALSLLREGGGSKHSSPLACITAEERERIGPIPVGHGLLEVVLVEGSRCGSTTSTAIHARSAFLRITRRCTRCSPCLWSRTAVCWAISTSPRRRRNHFRCR